MNTNNDTLRERCASAWKKHRAYTSAFVGGLMMGILFASQIELYRAAPHQILVHKGGRLQSHQQEQFSFPIAAFSIASEVFSIPHSRAPKKVTIHVEPVFSSSVSFSASSLSSSISQASGRASVSSSRASLVSESFSSSIPEVVVAPISPDFPAFGRAQYPVWKTPNWGAMRTPSQWNRSYTEMQSEDLVPIPRYDLSVLVTPMQSLTNPITEDSIPLITAKLFYSTRHMGTYDIDAGEYTGSHPGVDFKLARGTPVGAIGGGRVFALRSNDTLGKYVVLEHRIDGEQYFSIYGHLSSFAVDVGEDVRPGAIIGYVGMTGNTASPHLHLEVNKGFLPDSWVNLHGAAGGGEGSEHPIHFIHRYR